MENRKILIVDDNALNRKVFENILMNNYLYDSAKDGEEAIEKIKMVEFDLILMDIQMPKLDGISALRIIKEDNLTVSPIIAVSAYSNQADREYFLSTGFDDFIAKPVKPRDLLESISLHLKKSRAKSESRTHHVGELGFDESVILQLMKYHTLENIKSVYYDFLEEAENLVNEIKILLNLEKFEEITEKLHIIKGNSGTLGINNIFAVSSKFEADLKNDDVMQSESHYQELERCLSDFRTNMNNNKLFEKYE
jgi:CheY-like chemotaxis protein/HPt (histidine-containing phosphotransfer) domain-containing protein